MVRRWARVEDTEETLAEYCSNVKMWEVAPPVREIGRPVGPNQAGPGEFRRSSQAHLEPGPRRRPGRSRGDLHLRTERVLREVAQVARVATNGRPTCADEPVPLSMRTFNPGPRSTNIREPCGSATRPRPTSA